MRIVGRRQRAMHGIEHALILLRSRDRQHARIGFFDRFRFRAHAARDDHLAVLGHGFTDGAERFLLGAIEEAAGIDDDKVGTVVLACELIAFRPQPRDDALGIHQRLGAPQRNKADFGRGGLLHIFICLIDRQELVPIAHNYKALRYRLACYGCAAGL